MKNLKARILELEKRLGMYAEKVTGHLKGGHPIFEAHSGEHAGLLHPKWKPAHHEEARKFHAGKAGEQVHPMRMGVPGAKEKYEYHNNQAAHHVVAAWDKHKSSPTARPRVPTSDGSGRGEEP